MLRIFFSAGEPSGDIHASGLIKEIRQLAPDADIVGFGGECMQNAGCTLLSDMTKHSIMWFAQAVSHYLKYRKLLARAEAFFTANQVDAVVLVDYPGFNWHVAAAARKHNIPVFYFMPPQIWAWAQWRVKKMKRLINHTLVPLRFEERWLNQHNIKTDFIGHPFFYEMRSKKYDTEFLDLFFKENANCQILTLLPGSRNSEVTRNTDDMLDAVDIVHQSSPNVRVFVAAFNQDQADWVANRIAERNKKQKTNKAIAVYANKTAELIQAADCCMAVSGSVTMELLASNKPTVVYYRVSSAGHLIQRLFRRSKFITLVNILATDQATPNNPDSFLYDKSKIIIPAEPSQDDREQMLFPEFLTNKNRSKDAASILANWLMNPESLAKTKRELDDLLKKVDEVQNPLKRASEILMMNLVGRY
ncbi:MAG: hypothetical protein LBU65_09190 [Planctomycetaceae bacterium]|jgi:lipid-A-disaccharide synthase|nr:hypothetical protein [Planctomycetaceae bacterium]